MLIYKKYTNASISIYKNLTKKLLELQDKSGIISIWNDK